MTASQALAEVIKVVDQLEDADDATRVLRAACTYFDVTIPCPGRDDDDR